MTYEPDRILVVDDEPDMVDTCRKMLTTRDYLVETATDPEEALRLFEGARWDLVIADLKMPGMDGLELVKRMHRLVPGQLVVVITAYASASNAITAIHAGAFDFIRKPFQMDDLLVVVDRALRVKSIRDENRRLQRRLCQAFSAERIIGDSRAMRHVLARIRKLSEVDVPALICGESGTGKELFARTIHENSARGKGPFMAVDCAALPENLLESELFGYEKGAFTGAYESRPGLFEAAAGGTVLLDEIGELPVSLQAKLLRTLQEGRIRRLGGKSEIEIDVRLISATHRDLRAMIEAGEFREDFYFRINVVEVQIPPLRERTGDITKLAQHFFQRFQSKLAKKLDGISAAALLILEGYSWPGNVRELRNVIERACTLSESTQVLPSDLPDELLCRVRESRDVPQGDFAHAKQATVRRFECRYLERALSRAGGNVTEAARQSGLSRPAFHRLMAKHDIQSSDFR